MWAMSIQIIPCYTSEDMYVEAEFKTGLICTTYRRVHFRP